MLDLHLKGAPIPRVLFLCTGNCCRSPLAEALLRDVAGDRFTVASAGAMPAGYIHPLTLNTLESLGVSAEGLSSKSWHEVATTEFDMVFHLCEVAADANPPSFPGSPLVVHWHVRDPSCHFGDERERLDLCGHIAERLRLRVTRLAALDFEGRSRDELQRELELLADL